MGALPNEAICRQLSLASCRDLTPMGAERTLTLWESASRREMRKLNTCIEYAEYLQLASAQPSSAICNLTCIYLPRINTLNKAAGILSCLTFRHA